MANTKSPIHVSVDTDVLNQFSELSQKANKSRNHIINELIIEWIEDYKDYLLAESVMKNEEEVISHNEFMNEIKLLQINE